MASPPVELSKVDGNVRGISGASSRRTAAVVEAVSSTRACSTQHSKKSGPAWTDRMGVVAVPARALAGAEKLVWEGIQSCGCCIFVFPREYKVQRTGG